MPQRVAIIGAAGQLGRQLVRAYGVGGANVLPLRRPGFDITRSADLDQLRGWRPEVVVNAAAWTDVDGCALDPGRAMLVNGEAAGAVARAASDVGALIVQVSTNEVFDGLRERPFEPDDDPNPCNPYGVSKLAGERLVAAANSRHLVVRTAWLFGPEATNFVTKILAAAARAKGAGEPLRAVADEWGNPTPTAWLARAIVAAAAEAPVNEGLVLHLVGWPPTTRADWARLILRDHGVQVVDTRLADYPRASRVPPRAILRPSAVASAGHADWRAATLELVAASVPG